MPAGGDHHGIIEEQQQEIAWLRRELARVTAERGGRRADDDSWSQQSGSRAADRLQRQPASAPRGAGTRRHTLHHADLDRADLSPRLRPTSTHADALSSLPSLRSAYGGGGGGGGSRLGRSGDDDGSDRDTVSLADEVEALREELSAKKRTVEDVEAAVSARAELRASLQREAEELRADSEELREELSRLRADCSNEDELAEELRLQAAAEERIVAAERRRAECEAEFEEQRRELRQQAEREQGDLDSQRVELAAEYEEQLAVCREQIVAELETAKGEIVSKFTEERAKLRGRVAYLEKAIERKQREIEEWHEKNQEAQALLQRTKDAHARAQAASKHRADQLRGQADRGDRQVAKVEAELADKQKEVERLKGVLHQYLSGSEASAATPRATRRPSRR
eukprot:TRINITY_DN9594_c3_g2_i1.p2 TRINITY_DN9594_c3_g2~~TRINITY_DN9594_c3_g2_i1.p2  ORF type:complete len:398 (+),score=178.14 TRINITY_DN9594_c3_g2_i1:78-1271(+)